MNVIFMYLQLGKIVYGASNRLVIVLVPSQIILATPIRPEVSLP